MTRGMTSFIKSFGKDQNGDALVEFGLVIPILFLFLAVVIDGGRMAWIYQTASYGVRDAARMVARVAPSDLCSGGNVAVYDAMVTEIVTNSISDMSVIPNAARVIDVTPTLDRCVTGGYRNGTAAIVQVSAEIEIDYIWGGVFGLFGSALGPLTTEVRDQSRVYGL